MEMEDVFYFIWIISIYFGLLIISFIARQYEKVFSKATHWGSMIFFSILGLIVVIIDIFTDMVPLRLLLIITLFLNLIVLVIFYNSVLHKKRH